MTSVRQAAQLLWRRNRGSAALEFALIYGLLLAMILLVAHVALLYNANLTVSDAANAALEELTNNSGTEQSAIASANYIAQGAPMDGFEIKVWESGSPGGHSQVFVQASARSPELIFGLPVEVSHTASGTLEEFLTETQRES